MKKRILKWTGMAALLCFSVTTNAQIIVTGDTILCPQGDGTLTVNTHDSYQWLKRDYFGSVANPIAGETSSSLVMDYDTYAATYISVEVTDGGIVDTSDEVLVDGWMFAGPVVSTTGEFTIGNNGEAILCVGDTLWLTFLSPYTENITWFDGGVAIPGENSPVLEVTGPGSFTVEGAPGVCPDYIVLQGVAIDVVMDNCGLGLGEEETVSFDLYPNPATDLLSIEGTETILGVTICNSLGQQVAAYGGMQTSGTIAISTLVSGMYFLTIQTEKGTSTKQFCVN